VRQVQVEGVGLGYIETLADWEQRQQQGTGVSGETDRIYLDTPNAEHRRPALEPAHHLTSQRLTL
jgi:D-hexose-6-phosphate mutarotase